MSENAAQIPPRVLKGNLRRIVGGHIREQRLGHYLDFDVVVIPPGRHVTEFPTADAAFHPYQKDDDWGDNDAALEIRVVPWVIFKISANEPLSRKLAAEVGSFWRAGVEQMWEIRAWNRSIALHVPGASTRVFSEDSRLPACPVLPDLGGTVAELFGMDDDTEMIPQGAIADTDSWRIAQQWDRKDGRRSGKSAHVEFSAAPASSARESDPYREVERPRGFQGVAEVFLGSWTGRLLLGAVALVLLTTTIYLVLETHSSSQNVPAVEIEDPAKSLSPETRFELAKATARAYFQSDTPEKRLELVRHPEVTRARILRFYEEVPVKTDVVSVFGTPREERTGGRDFLVLPTYIGGKQTDLFFEEFPAGGFLVDWESEVGYNGVRFPVFRTKAEPTATEFRVFATESDRYSDAFPAGGYFPVQLHFPESGESAMGYIDRAAPDFPALEKLVTGQYRARIRLILEMPEARRITSETDSDAPKAELPGVQVRITGVAGDSWLAAE